MTEEVHRRLPLLRLGNLTLNLDPRIGSSKSRKLLKIRVSSSFFPHSGRESASKKVEAYWKSAPQVILSARESFDHMNTSEIPMCWGNAVVAGIGLRMFA